MTYGKTLNRIYHPQTSPLVQARPDQVKNNAGGYGFALDQWKQLDRFLMIGTIGGTYYVNEEKLTMNNLDAITACIQEDGLRVLARVVSVSSENKAPKNDPAILVMAMCLTYGDPVVRSAVRRSLPVVCRTGTHLFHFAEYLKQLGKGWGRATRGAVANWYVSKKTPQLVHQLVKYQQRDGWSHADLLRLSHANPLTKDQEAAFRIAIKGIENAAEFAGNDAYQRWEGFRSAHRPGLTTNEIVQCIVLYDLEREMLPTEALNHAEVWEALLPNMGITAVLRNLSNLASIGLLTPGSAQTSYLMKLLADQEALKRQRIHPLGILQAFAIYRQGHGIKGDKQWKPIPQVLDALDNAFYLAFASVKPTGVPLLGAVDVSGSMRMQRIDSLQLSAAQVSMALAVVLMHTEPGIELIAFDTNAYALNISKRQRLDDIMNAAPNGGGTDISVPIRYMIQQRLPKHIAIFTDAETWAGKVHVFEAVKAYRKTVFPDARIVNVAMTANASSIIPSDDPLSLETVGFSIELPGVVSSFINGEF